MVLVAGVSLNVSAQFKIGGKSINTKKLVNAASDVAKAVTLSDEDVAAMAREYIQWMDTHNEIAGPETAMGQRLANLTKDIKVEGLDLNFKVYNVIDVNAFACGDGSVRVCGGLMKIMDDNEVLAVIGHSIQQEDNTWLVEGPWLQRLMANINFSDYESRMYFDKMLRQSGLFDQLERMGIQDGDIVSMYNLEFEYQR